MSFLASRKASLAGTGSWFQQVTFFPALISASVSPSCEPMQSPSGRTWPTTQIDSLALMASTMRSTIFGWTFILGLGGLGFFDFVDDRQDAIAALDRFVDFELQVRRVFEHDRAADHSLETFGFFVKQDSGAFALVRCANHSDV